MNNWIERLWGEWVMYDTYTDTRQEFTNLCTRIAAAKGRAMERVGMERLNAGDRLPEIHKAMVNAEIQEEDLDE